MPAGLTEVGGRVASLPAMLSHAFYGARAAIGFGSAGRAWLDRTRLVQLTTPSKERTQDSVSCALLTSACVC